MPRLYENFIEQQILLITKNQLQMENTNYQISITELFTASELKAFKGSIPKPLKNQIKHKLYSDFLNELSKFHNDLEVLPLSEIEKIVTKPTENKIIAFEKTTPDEKKELKNESSTYIRYKSRN